MPLNDNYAVIKDMQPDIKTKYQLIEGKVAALKNTLEKFAEVEKKMTEMVNTNGNAIQLKKTQRQSFIEESFKDQMAEINERAINN